MVLHGFIYAICNESSGKAYVGQTVRDRVERRWYEHQWALNRGTAANRHLQASWAHHGPKAFQFIELERVEAPTPQALKERLTEREGFWMKTHREQGWVLFNAQDAGDSMAYLRRGLPSPKKGTRMSEDQRLKVVASLKGNQRRKGIPFTDEGRANVSAGRKGQPSPKKGKPASPAHKAALDRIAQNRIGTTHTSATLAKMRESAKGRTWTLVNGVRVYSGTKSEGAA